MTRITPMAVVLSAVLAVPALAAEPMTLDDAQMDTVSAGGNRLVVDIIGDNITSGNFDFDNLPGVFSNASVSVNTQVISGTVFSFIRLDSDTFD